MSSQYGAVLGNGMSNVQDTTGIKSLVSEYKIGIRSQTVSNGLYMYL